MNTPESMKAELAAWNNGAGIDLESWIGCEGRFSLAVGYASIFWPAFTLIEGYILPQGFQKVLSVAGNRVEEPTIDRVGYEPRSHR